MEITAYTAVGCSSCTILKQLFERAAVEYKQIEVRNEMTLEDFNQQFPHVYSFPYVIIDGKEIGGLGEVARLFVQKGLVSSKKE
jgi:glutaredoxin